VRKKSPQKGFRGSRNKPQQGRVLFLPREDGKEDPREKKQKLL
jgi:hypothetical protein